MIQRWECEEYEYGCGYMRAYDHRMEKDPDGDYVLYTDHLQEVKKWQDMEETQRQKKEFYHEESARLTVEKAELQADRETLIATNNEKVRELEIARAYQLELQEKLERRACHVVKLKEALRDLMDEQNGPPLIRHKDKWEAAMTKAREALKEG